MILDSGESSEEVLASIYGLSVIEKKPVSRSRCRFVPLATLLLRSLAVLLNGPHSSGIEKANHAWGEQGKVATLAPRRQGFSTGRHHPVPKGGEFGADCTHPARMEVSTTDPNYINSNYPDLTFFMLLSSNFLIGDAQT